MCDPSENVWTNIDDVFQLLQQRSVGGLNRKPCCNQRTHSKCLGPSQAVSAKAGGVLKASAPGQLPQNEKQISNFKTKLAVQSRASAFPHLSLDAAADDLFVVMQQAYTEDASKKFVRAVYAAPEPAVVVATELQLQDLAHFCTSLFELSILTVDPTFCLGEFDVTLITFRHLFLQSKRFKTPPVFVGLVCIHHKKSFLTDLFPVWRCRISVYSCSFPARESS